MTNFLQEPISSILSPEDELMEFLIENEYYPSDIELDILYVEVWK